VILVLLTLRLLPFLYILASELWSLIIGYGGLRADTNYYLGFDGVCVIIILMVPLVPIFLILVNSGRGYQVSLILAVCDFIMLVALRRRFLSDIWGINPVLDIVASSMYFLGLLYTSLKELMRESTPNKHVSPNT